MTQNNPLSIHAQFDLRRVLRKLHLLLLQIEDVVEQPSTALLKIGADQQIVSSLAETVIELLNILAKSNPSTVANPQKLLKLFIAFMNSLLPDDDETTTQGMAKHGEKSSDEIKNDLAKATTRLMSQFLKQNPDIDARQLKGLFEYFFDSARQQVGVL